MASRIAARSADPTNPTLGLQVEPPSPAVGPAPIITIPTGDNPAGMVLVTASTSTLRAVRDHFLSQCHGESDDDGMDIDAEPLPAETTGTPGPPLTGTALASHPPAGSTPAQQGAPTAAARQSAGSETGSPSTAGASDTAGYILYLDMLLAADPSTTATLNPRAPKCVTRTLEFPDADSATQFCHVINDALVAIGHFGLAWPSALGAGASTVCIRPGVKRTPNSPHGPAKWARAHRWRADSWPVAVIDAVTTLAWGGATPCANDDERRATQKAMNFALTANRYGDWVVAFSPPAGRYRECLFTLPSKELTVDSATPPLQWTISAPRALLSVVTPALGMGVINAARGYFDPHGAVVWAPLALHADHWVLVGEASKAFAPTSGGRLLVKTGLGCPGVSVACERCARLPTATLPTDRSAE
jgi:hypothetical protein